MKICILTQPLGTNYGGILQAYALQTILKNAGHEVFTENRIPQEKWINKLKKNPFLRFIFRKKGYILTTSDRRTIYKNTNEFVEKYITQTSVNLCDNPKKLSQYQFDAFIVGSDQVWRPEYSHDIKHYFLDFLTSNDVVRLSYAASFGTDNWTFDDEQTSMCSRLLRDFKAVSVREEPAVGLCRKYLDGDATLVLDPTLLLIKEDYLALIKDNGKNAKGVCSYILDSNEKKTEILDYISIKLNNEVFSILPNDIAIVGPKNISDCIYPSVQDWLKRFAHADYIITDSFHGTVFSIIFNKPFIVIANKERGLSRFTSLLSMFGLLDRLVNSVEDINDELLTQPIDYCIIDAVMSQKRVQSLNFLLNNLYK